MKSNCEGKAASYSLTDAQCSILDHFFESYLLVHLRVLTIRADLSREAMLTRLYLAFLSLKTEVPIYCAALDKFLPEDASLHENEKISRDFFIGISELCCGKSLQGDTSMDTSLYMDVFDPRISNATLNSPTKRNIISKYFIRKFKKSYRDGLNFVEEEKIDSSVDAFIFSIKYPETLTPVKRCLFF